MPRVDWRILFAVVGLIAFAFAIYLGVKLNPEKIPIRSNSAVESVTAHYEAGGRDCEPSRLDRLTGLKRARETERCANAAEEQRKERNSYIQAGRSADAAEAQAIYTFDQARVAAIGGALGVVTMVAAILAAIYAGGAAFHTERSANFAENALRANRPWLGPIGFTKLAIRDGFANDMPVKDTIGFMFRWKNWGSTPAVRVSFGFAYKFVSQERRDVESIEDVPIFPGPASFIGPGQEISGGSVFFSQDEVDTFRAGKTVLLMASKATYLDARGPIDAIRHETTHLVCANHIGGIEMGPGGVVDETMNIQTRQTIAT